MKRRVTILSTVAAVIVALMPLTALAHGQGSHGNSASNHGSGGQSSTSGKNSDSHASTSDKSSGGHASTGGQVSASGKGSGGQTAKSGNGADQRGSSAGKGTKQPNSAVAKNIDVVSNDVNAMAKTKALSIPKLSNAVKNNEKVKNLIQDSQQMQKALSEKETLLKKEVQTLASMVKTTTMSQRTVTSLQAAEVSVQKSLKLAKTMPFTSNKGGELKGLARALSVLQANEARMKQESSALTAAINEIEALIQGVSSTTTVTGTVYGSGGTTSGASSADGTSTTTSPSV